jgi:hypothetical protein
MVPTSASLILGWAPQSVRRTGRRCLRYRVGVFRALLAVCAGFALASCSAGGDTGDVPDPATSSPAPANTPTATVSPPQCDDEPCYADVEALGRLGPDIVTEVSGMAGSHRSPGLYYVIGDPQGTSEVAVVHEDGSLVGHLEIDGLSARNAEDLAVGPCGPDTETTCLFIGDFGNHVGLPDLFIHRIPEPDLGDLPAQVTPDSLRYTYPGEPTDAEALLVDREGRPIIISKASFDETTGETGPTQVFRGGRDGGILEHLSDLRLPLPESPFFADLVGHVVTSADATEGRVIVRTYDEIYEYLADDSDAGVGTFAEWPVRRVPAPFQMQSETIAYRIGGCGYITTSELTGEIHGVGCH